MKTITKLPKFTGKPLIEIPENIPQADFLSGEFGKAVLEEYKARVKEDYHNNSALNVLKYEDKIVRGSNSFAVCLVNQITKEEGLRTATQADLEQILKNNSLELKGHYEDTSLVLRSEENPNEYPAKHLMKQIKSKFGKKLQLPLMIPLYGLEIERDENSPHKLVFNLTDNSELIYAPILNEDSAHFKSEDIDEKIGLPKKLGEGDRYFWTRKTGLCGLYSGDVLSLDSDYDRLEFSDSHGRVVIVKAG